MVIGAKYRIYPNDKQKLLIEKTFGCCRYIYNHFLEVANQSYQENKKTINEFEMRKQLTVLRRETDWLREVPQQALGCAIRNLSSAFSNFFRKTSGHPTFKSKHKSNQSFNISQWVRAEGKKMSLQKCGWIKIAIKEPLRGRIMGTTVSRNAAGQYYASFTLDAGEVELPEPTEFDPKTTIGIDLGIRRFAVLSTGEIIDNPRYLEQSQRKLAREQRRFSRKKKGGANRKKQKIKVARVHRKIANQRNDFLHKLTYRLTHENQVGTICIEDLAIRDLLQTRYVARGISDAAWGMFREQLTYKCKLYGKRLIVISRYAPTSQMCFDCGAVNEELILSQRTWTCSCGAKWDRDMLAAQNIRRFGIELYHQQTSANS